MSATSTPTEPEITVERHIARTKIKVPMALATGRYEYLTNEELYDHLNDITAEARRRAEANALADDGSA